jgi:serine/threonine protein kinase
MGSKPIWIPGKSSNHSTSEHKIEHIGEGSFADVYLNSETNIIIKRINIQKITDEKKNISKTILRDYVQTEIDIIKNLSHDNIISFVFSDIYDDVYDIYLEYCEHGDMSSILKNEKVFCEFRNSYTGFAGDFLKDFICQVSDGLIYLHQHNIIHRDIKPHNILVTSERNFKICDFGFSCIDISKQTELLSGDYTLTPLEKKYFNKSGTPYYMAPEIYSEMCYDTSSDCWSLGITIYETYFRKLPFPKMSKMNEIEEYLRNIESELFIHDQIISHLAPNTLKIILIGLLRINRSDRMSLFSIKELLLENDIEEEIELDSINSNSDQWEELDDISSQINIKEQETNNFSETFLRWLKNNND